MNGACDSRRAVGSLLQRGAGRHTGEELFTIFLTDERRAGTSAPLSIIHRWDPAEETQSHLQCVGWSRCQLDCTEKHLGVSHGEHLVCL